MVCGGVGEVRGEEGCGQGERKKKKEKWLGEGEEIWEIILKKKNFFDKITILPLTFVNHNSHTKILI